MGFGRGLSNRTSGASTVQARVTHNGLGPSPAEDDEIPLESGSKESRSSPGVSMSNSDGEDGYNPLISVGNEHVPTQPGPSSCKAIVDPAAQQNGAISKKRKPQAAATTLYADAPIKKVKLDENMYSRTPPVVAPPRDKSLLPAEIWHRIFTFTPPKALANLLRTNRLFNVYLNASSPYQCLVPPPLQRTSISTLEPDVIWQLSRRRFWPGMPAPLQQKTELDMWRLACGKKCQFCNKVNMALASFLGSQSPCTLQLVWAFALRSCGPCLIENTIKEFDLLLSPSMPSILVPAVPFALVADGLHVISPGILQNGVIRGDVQVTKIYLYDHVERLKQEFLSAKSMGRATADEWLEGLATRKKELLNDSMRWEKWASIGGVTQMQTKLSQDDVPGMAILTDKGKLPPNISSSAPRSPTLGHLAKRHKFSPCRTPKVTAPHSTQTEVPHIHDDSISRIPSGLQPNVQLNGSRARTLEEALELKAARRAEIERRAMELDPPLPANILARIPSFQAAIQLISPLDGDAWDLLKPRLLAQRASAEQREQEEQVSSRPRTNPEQSEGYGSLEQNTVVTKQLVDKAWDDLQAPLRAQISVYADEIIRNTWDGGRKVDMENSPQFAAEALLYVRRRFYTEIAKDSAVRRAVGQEPLKDPSEGPFTQKLTLENMKWLFDVKIKPHTEAYRKDLFFCNSCEMHSKAFGFEGVIQHYAAKHTNALSRGSVVVHWRAEWPETPPFKPNPLTITITSAPSSYGNSPGTLRSQNNAYLHHSASAHPWIPNLATSQPSPYHGSLPPSYEHSLYGPMMLQPTAYWQGNFYIPGQHNHGSSYPLHPPSYSPHGPTYTISCPPIPPGIRTESLAYSPTIDIHYSHHYNIRRDNSQTNLQNPYSHMLIGNYRAQLEYLARSSREIWALTTGLKELSECVRIHVVIYHVVQRFRDKFSESPPLTMFIDGLSNNKEMRSVRNINGLMCKACHIGLGSEMWAEPDRRLFSLPQLANHFQRRHIDQPQAIGVSFLDWTHYMVYTPDLSMLSGLRYMTNMDDQKYTLISGAFPPTQRPNGYSQGFSTPDTQVAAIITTYTSDQPISSTLTSKASFQFTSLAECSVATHDIVIPSIPDATQTTTPGRELHLNQPIMEASSLTTSLTPQRSNSGKASSETLHGKHASKAKRRKVYFIRDYRNISSHGPKNRKGGAVGPSSRIESQEPAEEVLVAEEERRHEQEIRAMWAADREETARLASRNKPSIEAEGPNTPRPISPAGRPDSSYVPMARTVGSLAHGTQFKIPGEPVDTQECEEDDLMADLEIQLDQQQVSTEHSGHQRRHVSDIVCGNEPPYGRRTDSKHSVYSSQGDSYGQAPLDSPRRIRCETAFYEKDTPRSRPTELVHGSTRTTATINDALYDRPHREYRHTYTDDPRVRQPAARHVTFHELARVRDSHDEYLIERPIKIGREPPYTAFQDELIPCGDDATRDRIYRSDNFSSSRVGYESISRIEISSWRPTSSDRLDSAGNLIRGLYEPHLEDDSVTYDDYDPRYPAAPPNLSTARQSRYQ